MADLIQKTLRGSHAANAEHLQPPHRHAMAGAIYPDTERGLWALKCSVAILAAGALLQFAVVIFSGSVALLADMIHNLADAATAIPLAIAFLAARRPPSARFTYGYGRLEDLAGLAIVLIILGSALAVSYESIGRLLNFRPVMLPGAVAAAGVIGFIANEAVASIRIRAGKEINSVALVADGHHARIDGLASLAVAAGAAAVKLGFPLADPLIGLAIAVMIAAIAIQSASAILVRMLDGVEARIIGEIRHAAQEVAGIDGVPRVRARWLGHRLEAEAEILVDPALSVREAAAIADGFLSSAAAHLPASANFRVMIATKQLP